MTYFPKRHVPSKGTPLNTNDCLDGFGADDPCEGPVEYHSIDPGRVKAYPRCAKHWAERLDRRANSIERWENSDVPPAWFDPADAGERWEDD